MRRSPGAPAVFPRAHARARGKSFRQEISVPDHGARIKAVETLLREGLGRVGEADVPTPRMPSTVTEVEAMKLGGYEVRRRAHARAGDPRPRRAWRRRCPGGGRP